VQISSVGILKQNYNKQHVHTFIMYLLYYQGIFEVILWGNLLENHSKDAKNKILNAYNKIKVAYTTCFLV